MSSDRWPTHRKIVTAACLFIGLCLFTLAVFDAGYSTAKHGNQAEHHTQEYAEQADRDIKAKCTSTDVAILRSCIKQIVEATNEHEREESDLYAQRDMAKWALYMLAATVAAAFAAIIGIGFIWNDTRETRKLGQAQVRAYVGIGGYAADWKSLPNQVDAWELGLNVRLQNSGQSPALNCEVSGFGTRLTEEEFGKPFLMEKSLVPLDLDNVSINVGEKIFASGVSFNANDIEEWRLRDGQLVVVVRIKYLDVFGRSQTVTSCNSLIDTTDSTTGKKVIKFTIYPYHNS